jgi:FAD synthetase
MSRRVLVFGTFDQLHTGHEFLLRSAKTRGDYLIVGVALDEHVKTLKDKTPRLNQERRRNAVEQVSVVDEAVLCDEELGSFEILKKTKPDVIVLGHDQYELEQSLIDWMSTSHSYIPMVKSKKINVGGK